MGYAGIKRNIEKKGFKKTFLAGTRHRLNLFRARKVLACRRQMGSDGWNPGLLGRLIDEEAKLEKKDTVAFQAYKKHIERKRDSLVLPKLKERYSEDRSLILDDFGLEKKL